MKRFSGKWDKLRFPALGQVKVHVFGTSCTKHHWDLRFVEVQRVLPKGGFASLEVSEKFHRR